MLDRYSSPAFYSIEKVHIPDIQTIILKNGTPLHVVNVGEQPVCKLELVFEAGHWQDAKPAVSLFTAKMIGEGTTRHNAQAISEYFDQYGAFTEFTHGVDRASFVLYGLTKHLAALLPMVDEMLQEATFPSRELETIKTIQRQTLEVNQEKTAFVANQKLKGTLFGTQHPYGFVLDNAMIDGIDQAALLDFYQRYWKNKPCRIFLAGRITETEIALVERFFGQYTIEPAPVPVTHAFAEASTQQVLVEKAQAMQSSVRLGKTIFTRNHPDYFNLLIVNEILGGYFGSRLMKNIREEKGLTYGIGSNVVPLSKAGYFVIGTDVKKEFTQLAIDEIYKEIQVLQTELINDEELTAVRNYMLGSIAGSVNTPFEIADRYKVILSEGLPIDFYTQYFEHIKQIKAEAIAQTAQRYLATDSFAEVVVGGK